LLLSGVSAAGDGVKVAVDRNTQQQTEIAMDISHSLMFSAEEYMDQFTVMKGGVERPRYTPKSSKWTAMASACAAHYNGASINNKVKAFHHQHTNGVTVQKEPEESEVGHGIKVMMVGKSKNPEHICHVELTAGETRNCFPFARRQGLLCQERQRDQD
jgi:hypothetical protein